MLDSFVSCVTHCDRLYQLSFLFIIHGHVSTIKFRLIWNHHALVSLSWMNQNICSVIVMSFRLYNAMVKSVSLLCEHVLFDLMSNEWRRMFLNQTTTSIDSVRAIIQINITRVVVSSSRWVSEDKMFEHHYTMSCRFFEGFPPGPA